MGKGLTFDSGGYNIKAGAGSMIELMKFDMVSLPTSTPSFFALPRAPCRGPRVGGDGTDGVASRVRDVLIRACACARARITCVRVQGGAGATLGAARVVGALQPPGLELHFIVAACENMIDGKGLRPGDVLTSASGAWRLVPRLSVPLSHTDAGAWGCSCAWRAALRSRGRRRSRCGVCVTGGGQAADERRPSLGVATGQSRGVPMHE